jgi:cellulose synthase/poly-beta-1,6-N-acetylglucosamine synthase-like glycosyltransferase
MKYKIVIPSYNRADTLATKTIPVLQRQKINPKDVYVFVANEDEKKKYQAALPEEYKSRLIVGVKGMKNIRNFINDYFPRGEQLFHMDDLPSLVLNMEILLLLVYPICLILMTSDIWYQ